MNPEHVGLPILLATFLIQASGVYGPALNVINILP